MVLIPKWGQEISSQVCAQQGAGTDERCSAKTLRSTLALQQERQGD